MKRALKVLCAFVVFALVVGIAWWGYDRVFVTPSIWYVQIDNDLLSEAGENNNGFDFHYDLPAASADGTVETIGFDTARELRDGAYLRLETLAMRGVRTWEEVAWEAIPAPAQEALETSDAGASGA